MASLDTVHSMSVLTNSSVKAPVNPHSGLSMTINERPVSTLSKDWMVPTHGYSKSVVNQINEEISKSGDIYAAVEAPKLDTDLANLSNEEFYEKLQELKAEHEKKLAMCAELYRKKTGHSSGDINSRNVALSSLSAFQQQPNNSVASSMDSSPKIASKPPLHPFSPHRSSTEPKKRAEKLRTAWSADDQFWRPPSQNSDEGRKSDHEFDIEEPSRDDAMSKIEKMWEDFTVNDYDVPTRARSCSFAYGDKNKTTPKPPFCSGENWRHRITVPEPFEMMKRENLKTEKTKTRAMRELESKRVEREKREEIECSKKFKATPVPAHVYMPLYEELKEQRETKSRFNREFSSQKLQQDQKPFNFTKREDERKRQCRRVNNDLLIDESVKNSRDFKARPFPERIFSTELDDRAKEEEEYRKIRLKIHAEDLLRSSSLPPNMSSRGHDYFMGKSRVKERVERLKKKGFVTQHDFKPKVNKGVPRFDDMHRKLARDMSDVKTAREGTVCRPFKFHGRTTGKSIHKVYKDIENDQKTLTENRWPFKSSREPVMSTRLDRSMSSSMDSLPLKTTSTQEMRRSSANARKMREEEAARSRILAHQTRAYKERELRRQVAVRAAAHDNTGDLRRARKDKLKEHRESDRERARQYSDQLREIQEKVASRPLLFERESEMAARVRAEKRYKDTLKRAGIDEEFLERKRGQIESEALDDFQDGGHGGHFEEGDTVVIERHFEDDLEDNLRSKASAAPSSGKNYTDDFDDGLSEGDLSIEEVIADD